MSMRLSCRYISATKLQDMFTLSEERQRATGNRRETRSNRSYSSHEGVTEAHFYARDNRDDVHIDDNL